MKRTITHLLTLIAVGSTLSSNPQITAADSVNPVNTVVISGSFNDLPQIIPRAQLSPRAKTGSIQKGDSRFDFRQLPFVTTIGSQGLSYHSNETTIFSTNRSGGKSLNRHFPPPLRSSRNH